MAGYRDFQTGEVLTAANVNDYLAKQSVMKFADATARDTALGTAVGGGNALREGMVAYLDDTDEVLAYDGTAWGSLGGLPLGTATPVEGSVLVYGTATAQYSPSGAAGYLYAGTEYFTSSGTFDKADPLGTGDIGLRAVRVRLVGGGGGGGENTGGGGGGGGGGYAEAFILAGSLSSSETVTVGSGGAGKTGGTGDGGTGGASSFGSLAAANGGVGGLALSGGGGGTGTTGDLLIKGGGGGTGSGAYNFSSARWSGEGGDTLLGGSVVGRGLATTAGNGGAGQPYGGGGAGGRNTGDGGNGAAGIVIVECFV